MTLALIAAGLFSLWVAWRMTRTAARATPPRPRRVLLVDDEPSIIKAMPNVWGAELGVEVESVGSVREAVERLTRVGVDVVVMDWRFQGQEMQGHELFTFVRANFPHMVVEVWTAYRHAVRDVPEEHIHDKPSDRGLRAALGAGFATTDG